MGAIDQTEDRKEAACVKPEGESRARWGEARTGTVSVPGAVRPGAYCAPQEAKGKTAQGAAYTCAKASGGGKARWQQQ
ncbi:hypothetical protein [Actinomadura gamaensis]|uniref:Uncharacterized protein n=1 Tax=Actinomadura gamaensis TaxID=1763541 RepID=A0ABV9TYL8_9ACTN